MEFPLAPGPVVPHTSLSTHGLRASTSALASSENTPALRKASKFRHVTPVFKSQTPYLSSPLASASHQSLSRTNSVPSEPQQSAVPDSRKPESELPIQPTTTRSPLTSPNLSQSALPPLPPHISSSDIARKPITSSLVSSTAIIQASSVKRDVLPPIPGEKPASPRSSAASRLSIPYRPGFQPRGVLRYLTDDFLALRTLKRDGADNTGGMKRVERNKLERRLEKLIDLHFPSRPLDTTTSTLKRRQGSGIAKEIRRTASIFDLDAYKNINLRDAGDFWKNILTSSLGDNSKPDKRGAFFYLTKSSLSLSNPLIEAGQLWNNILPLGRKIRRYQNVLFVCEYPVHYCRIGYIYSVI